MSQMPKHRHLPDKEGKLFKELLTQYELKQYKKGLKAADTILKKYPNHGETLALKALTLHSSLPFPLTMSSAPKQEEAETMARTSVKKDITSHITWHVLGILAKGRKDWEEATRAFAMARKQDNDNIPLIRDSIALNLHTRQYPAAVSARHHYLLLRPQIRSSWLGLMISQQLNGDFEEALETYDGLMSCIKTDGATGPEKSQTVMHVVKIRIEAGKLGEALQRLETGFREGIVSPRGEATQLKAEILAALGRQNEAEDTYRALLEQNADSLEYYRGFLRTKGFDITGSLDDEATKKVLSLLSSFAESYPRSAAPRRLALNIARGDTFLDLARAYLVAGLERGVPSLFVDVKGVYTGSPEKMSAVGEIMEDVIGRLQQEAGLHDDDSIAPPTALLWAYYYLALHLSYPLHPNPSFARSLELLSLALEHTPTLPEVYMARAMVLKRAGDPLGAAEAMEDARLLDGQDRFLNGKAAKYWLRAGDVKQAEDLIALFTKKDTNAVLDLTDLQCLWFLQEEGDAHRRNGNLAMALKRYQALADVFQDYEDDQYDFHTYCMRRMTFSAYLSLMGYEDQLRSHPAYYNATTAAIEIYLQLYDDPSLTEEKLTIEEESERKKAAKKAQKAEQKARKAAVASGDGKKDEQPVPDDDTLGEKLLKTETPLEDAFKLWQPLEKMASKRIEVWTAGYEIYIRQKLYVAALKCLLEGAAIDAEDARLHWEVLHFRRIVDAAKDVHPAVTATIDNLLPTLILKEEESFQFNSSFRSRHPTSPNHILGAARGLLEIFRASTPLPTSAVEQVFRVLLRLVDDDIPPSIPILLDAAELLRSAGAEASLVDEYRARCKKRVPLAWVFASDEQKAKRAAERESQILPNGKADV